MKISKKNLDKINLTELAKLIPGKQDKEYFLSDPGREHYKLLAYMSTQFDRINIADIGTLKGMSALALSYNQLNTVDSYDIKNHREIKPIPNNIRFNLINAEYSPGILKADLIFLDTVHDGVHEKKVLDFLEKNEWVGVVIMDDIHHFPELNAYWKTIKQRKQDITDVGHWSGTGIVYFE